MILVTGASGFIGRHFCRTLKLHGMQYRAAIRNQTVLIDTLSKTISVGEVNEFTDWSRALEGCDTVFHLAARAHVLQEGAPDPWDSFLKVNVNGSIVLASQAARAGVKRFVFMSSVGVLGNTTVAPFTNESIPSPIELYAKSKLRAENAIRVICDEAGMELVIVRPPLVYGPGVPGNFLRLLKLLISGIPLPFSSITAMRSFVGIENLCHFLIQCSIHPMAAGQTLLISDGEDISLPNLLRTLAYEANLPIRMFPFPIALLEFAGKVIGRADLIHRLTSSLQIDSSHTREILDWVPPVSLLEGLRETSIWYRRSMNL